jgi:hypothetical protein
MKKALFILFISSCFSSISHAQFLIGPQAGVNFARLSGTTYSVTSKVGWHVGAFVSLPFSKHLSLMPGLLYELNQFDYTNTETTYPISDTVFQEVNNVNANLGYIDVPVLLTYFTSETKGLMIQAGMQLSVLLTDNSKITIDTVTVRGGTVYHSALRTDNNVKFSKSDISFVGGLGYKFSKLLIIYVRATTGFLKAQEGSYIKDADRGKNFVFQGGVALSFGAK